MNNEAKYFSLVERFRHRAIILESYLDDMHSIVDNYKGSIRLREIAEAREAKATINQINNELKFIEETLAQYV